MSGNDRISEIIEDKAKDTERRAEDEKEMVGM